MRPGGILLSLTMSRHKELATNIDRSTRPLGYGIHPTRIPRVALIRSDIVTEELHVVYEPSVCIVAQGSKRTIVSDLVLDYFPGNYLAVSVELPVIGQITKASTAAPYLCLRLDLDTTILTELILQSGLDVRHAPDPGLGIMLSDTTPEILDAAIRLARLTATPEAIPVLAPLIERELLYYLLTGPQGSRLCHIAVRESRTAQVTRAISWIKTNFREPFNIEKLALEARMSPSAFHNHFRKVTTMSPLQYQKQLRLQEARRLILTAKADAASASFQVGYSSPSQFSREYARVFGAPPMRDVARMRFGSKQEMALAPV